MKVVVQEDCHYFRAVQQVPHVVVQPQQLIHFGLQLGIHRLQHFVQGLQLLLGGLPLFTSHLHVFVELLQLLLQFEGTGSASRGGFAAAGCFEGRGGHHVGEDNHDHPPQRFARPGTGPCG